MVGSIVVVGALTPCAFLRCLYDLKAVRMNVQSSLIQELILYEFKMDHSTSESAQKICYAKSNGAVGTGTVTRWLKKFSSCSKTSTIRQGLVGLKPFIVINLSLSLSLSLSLYIYIYI